MELQLNQTRLGILGGGQLSRMLALEAHLLGLQVSVFTENPSDPAAQVVGNFRRGSIKNSSSVRNFAAAQDFVTFESEFAPQKTLKTLADLQPKVCVFPPPELMLTLQDRLTQKQWYDEHGIATSDWIHPQSIEQVLQFASKQEWPVVCKARHGGYDGYGTLIFKNARQLKKNPVDNWSDYICEKFVPFKRELAVQLVRNADSDFQVFPLVETYQQDSRCLWVKGPIEDKTSQEKLRPLIRKIKKAMTESHYTGILAIELFQTAKKELIVNEIAPRVHNSAHYSQDALSLGQFEAHIRGGLGLNLPKIISKSAGFAMINILGQSQKMGPVPKLDQGKFHWYGKLENRPGRKMGHINVLANSANAALKTALTTRKEVFI